MASRCKIGTLVFAKEISGYCETSLWFVDSSSGLRSIYILNFHNCARTRQCVVVVRGQGRFHLSVIKYTAAARSSDSTLQSLQPPGARFYSVVR